MYRIGAFSRLCQTPIKTLRYYDDIGLLRPAHVDPANGYRFYAAEQLRQINRVLSYKDLGVSLEETRRLVAESADSGQARRMLERKREEIASRLQAEKRRLARICAQLDLLEESAASETSPVVMKRAGAWLMASTRARLASHEECDELFEELEARVGAPCGRRQRGAIWHKCEPDGIDCEAFVCLSTPIKPNKNVSVREMPAQRVASLVYREDEDYMQAYRAARAWIAAYGLDVVGPRREIYLQTDDSRSGSMIEIQFPVSRESEAAPGAPGLRGGKNGRINGIVGEAVGSWP